MQQPAENVGSSVPVRAIAALVVALLVVAAGFAAYRVLSNEAARHEVVIATGSDGGTYDALGHALARVLEANRVVAVATVVPSEGSVANMAAIADPASGVDLAFVQGDTAPASRARLVAPLYDEVLHIVVRKQLAPAVQRIYDLRGLRVSLGPRGSGTRQLSEQVLAHFGVVPGEDVAMAPMEAAQALVEGSLDAAFILTAIPSSIVEHLAEQDAVRLVSLGDAQEIGNEADGLALVYPSLRGTTIPRSTYRRLPGRPVRTVSVTALLIAHRDLDTELVRNITAAIFEHRTGREGLEGDGLNVARKIREDFRPVQQNMPFHSGAVSYYDRAEPPFFVEYAEAISLGLTLLVGAYSSWIAAREWMRRRMKNRVDAYLMEVDRMTSDLKGLSVEQLIELRDGLDRVRQRAFSDLVRERLHADEAFTIFQNHLGQEFAAIEARIREKRVSLNSEFGVRNSE